MKRGTWVKESKKGKCRPIKENPRTQTQRKEERERERMQRKRRMEGREEAREGLLFREVQRRKWSCGDAKLRANELARKEGERDRARQREIVRVTQ